MPPRRCCGRKCGHKSSQQMHLKPDLNKKNLTFKSIYTIDLKTIMQYFKRFILLILFVSMDHFNPPMAFGQEFCRPAVSSLIQGPLPDKNAPLTNISSKYLVDIFFELQEIIYTNKITIDNEELVSFLYDYSGKDTNPFISTIARVAHIFNVDIWFLLENKGRLKNLIDLSKIKTSERPSDIDSMKIFLKTIHERLLFEFGRITDKSITHPNGIKELSSYLEVTPNIIHSIVHKKAVPRFFTLIQILSKLHIDPIAFFKQNAIISNHILYKITDQLWTFFKGSDNKSLSADALKAKNIIYQQNYTKYKIKTDRKPIKYIFQTAYFFNIKPSELIQHALKEKLNSFILSRNPNPLSGSFLSTDQMNKLMKFTTSFLLEKMSQQNFSKRQLEELGIHRNKRENMLITSNRLNSILKELGSHLTEFFRQLESTKEFNKFYNSIPQREALISADYQPEEFYQLGKRIDSIADTIESLAPSKEYLEKILTTKKNTKTKAPHYQRNLSFKTIYKVSRIANIPLNDLVSSRPIEDLINSRLIIIEKVPEEDIARAKEILRLTVLEEMLNRSISIDEMTFKSRVLGREIRRFLTNEMTPSYFSLRKIIEQGFEIPLEDFFKNVEERFKTLPQSTNTMEHYILPKELHTPYISKEAQENLNFIKKRFQQFVQFIQTVKVSNVSLRKIGIKLMPSELPRDGELHQVQLSLALKISRLLRISIQDFFSKKDFSLLVDVNNLHFSALTQKEKDHFFETIKENIFKKQRELNLSERDIKIMMSTRYNGDYGHIFHGPTALSFLQFFKIAHILSLDNNYLLLLKDIE